MAKDVPNMRKDMDIQIQESQLTPSTINKETQYNQTVKLKRQS